MPLRRCALPSLQKRHVAVARLKHPANMGRTCHEVRFFILVLTPSKEKGTKNALETGRTFATIFADMDFRQRLLEVHSEAEFKNVLLKHAQDLAAEQSNPVHLRGSQAQLDFPVSGVVGHRTIYKTVSTIFFLYFACLLPTIAFGALNDTNTKGKIGECLRILSMHA
ncbi:hypothetical protein HPB52_002569 [Rhipicephalus sanguineus]|uniref:PTS EIIA type-2 domain-containing protein n=1 Tax=Rhipicephalus sanguineus TaxID=34632 RepID=A0A9D4PCD8_RHISA|nr:hypothetical protein HPB52_002569 [Rhipicephalus sanguineus]